MISKKYNKGFTLVETLAAILLLSIALAGPMTIAQKGLRASLTAKNEDTAFNLAQDAIEYVRYARDTHCLTAGSQTGGCPAGSWLAGTGAPSLASCVSSNGSAACTIDDFAGTVAACTGGATGCAALNFNTTGSNYTYSPTGGAVISSPFTRVVQIFNPVCTGSICNNSESIVRVTISWSDPTAHSIVVQESIFNWE
jgi:prepilin-type N-terminal cleavage/methylation domain-containing protein